MITSDPTQILIETIFAIFELLAFLLSVFGNFVVIYVMTRKRKLRRKSSYHIISVAVADFINGLIGVPASLYTVRLLELC